jgi:betaine-aldehyde dehydrogenase
MWNYLLWIAGNWTAPSSGKSIDRHSPAHGGHLASYSAGSAKDVAAAVAAAHQAFETGPWRNLPGGEKSLVLNGWADLMQAKAGWLAGIEAEEAGKPIRAARGEIDAAIELVR